MIKQCIDCKKDTDRLYAILDSLDLRKAKKECKYCFTCFMKKRVAMEVRK